MIHNDKLGIKRFDVLSVSISAINMKLALNAVDKKIRSETKGYVCVTGVHGIIEAQKDEKFRRILNNSFLTTPDGMPLVWLGKLSGFEEIDRVYGPDLMLEMCAVSELNEYKHFFYGGAEGVVDELKDKLVQRFPALNIVGTYSPPFRPLNDQEEKELVQLIEETKPDIIWIGLSTPKQEKFMAEYLSKLNAKVMIGVGAAFDFHSHRVKQAPKWLQRSGFEWAFRLCQEPRRLWRRYLFNNSLFVLMILRQLITLTNSRDLHS